MLIDERDLEGVEGVVLYAICGADCDDLHVVLHQNLADDTMGKFVRLRAESKREFTLSVYRNASDLVPLLAYKLEANTAVCRRRDMLKESQ